MNYRIELQRNTNNIDMMLKGGKSRKWRLQILLVKYVNGDMYKAQTLITI